MNQHSRKSSGIALLATLALGIASLAAAGQFNRAHSANGSIDQLERAIASGHGDIATWTAYAAALQDEKRFDHAAQAYQRAIELQTDPSVVQKMRFNAALCLAQAGDPDKFFGFFAHLTTTDPTLAVGLLERPELAPMRKDPRWASAANTARAQAAD